MPVLTAALVTVILTLAAPAAGAEAPRAKDRLLPDGLVPLRDSDRALTTVAWAEGAPAVVLLEARQNEWVDIGSTSFLRARHFRRTKILTAAGVEAWGNYTFELLGDWRVKKVEARTVLPDGTVVDAAKGVFQERSDDGFQVIRVAFPRVQVGAILDFEATVTSDSWGLPPWVLQERIPVAESRFILVPPKELRYRNAGQRLEQDKLWPESTWLGKRPAFVWTFERVPALAEEANQPPVADISQALFVIPEAWRSSRGDPDVPFARDYKSFGERRHEVLERWLKARHGRAEALAREITEGKTTPADKAEAIRKALRARLRLTYLWTWPDQDSADDVLAKGTGNSAEIALTTVAMLRAVGVEAHLAAIRRRSRGTIPLAFPIPALFDDYLVRIPAASSATAPLFFSPVAEARVGTLPGDCTGLLAMPLDGKTAAPVEIPDLSAADNKSVRRVEVTLEASGKVRVEELESHLGAVAEHWRHLLRERADEQRKEYVEQALGRAAGGARLQTLEVRNLNDDTRALELRTTWEADGYATVAGRRLLVNLHLHGRIPAADWAPATRQFAIDLGQAYDEDETVVLHTPPEVGEVTLPETARIDAGKVGAYEATYANDQGTVTARRHLRVEFYRFPVTSYAGLRKWFTDIAAADDRPVVLTLR